MSQTSRTGLIASPIKKIYRKEKVATIQLKAVARPAPFILKPFAGLYNPYPHGCSLLCNHPTDNEAKELLKKAKDSWAADGKNVLLTDEIEAIRAGLEQCQPGEDNQKNVQLRVLESVPEELFRRYTETDSRPLTPAPTLASAATRASGSRRCVTPDPLTTNQIREKTLLVLDLRRSHSQETLSWHGSASLQEPPIIRIQRVPTRTASFEDNYVPPKTKSASHLLTHPASSRSPTPSSAKALKKAKPKEAEDAPAIEKQEENEKKSDDEEEADDDILKRRGKKKKKKREGSRGPPAFQTSIDPETQVAAIGPDSHNPSARPSLVTAASDELETTERTQRSARPSKCWEIDSFLDVEILKQLRRELDEEVIDNEFNQKRRTALKEALKTIPKDRMTCDALIQVQNELNLPPVNTDLWLSLPRVFTRSSARFELPLDSRTLEKMTPSIYVESQVVISSPRKLLYNCIFNKFKMENQNQNESQAERKILGSEMQKALNLMMGKPMTEKQEKYFRGLIGWTDDDVIDFKTFCGLCALCERLLAPEYCPQLADRKVDPCHEIETADFEALTRKLYGKKVDPRLVEILQGIKTR